MLVNMKVAWISIVNAQDPCKNSGRVYNQAHSLKAQSIDMEYIGSLQLPNLYKPFLYLKYRFYRNPFLAREKWKTYDHLWEPIVQKSYTRQISRRLSKIGDVDFVVSGLCNYFPIGAYLDCEQPLVTWTDCSLISALDFYPQLFRDKVAEEPLRGAIACERDLLNRASLVIYGSEWAAQEAISYYQLDSSKVKVVPLGPNLVHNYNSDRIRAFVDSRPTDRCKLLFVGYDWYRKGGDTAVRVAAELNKAGLPTELTIVGCTPPQNEPFVKSLGSISNTTAEGIKQLQTLFSQSHFFIMPTMADSFGHVFCEASSFGVPSLATNVGGIPTVIKDDVNGKKFSKDAKVEEYCTYISDLFSDYSRYKNLALSSFNEYESRLNCSVIGRTVKQLIADLL
jgi:glycosyltransferase involved in cell wall biosynthesis